VWIERRAAQLNGFEHRVCAHIIDDCLEISVRFVWIAKEMEKVEIVSGAEPEGCSCMT
jgi:hypothetical protein